MYEACYLLDTERLRRIKNMEALLDQERLQKYVQIKNEKVALQSLGAGLLLQLAAGEYLLREIKEIVSPKKDKENGIPLVSLHADELQERLRAMYELLWENQEPLLARPTGYLNLTYRYNEYGKPYFANLPVYFSLSHSGNQILCVCCEQEIGADIQRETDQNWVSIAKRFFREEENEHLRKMEDRDLARETFFQLWTRKEAYGKLLGEGVMKVMGIPLLDESGPLMPSWQDGQYVTEDGTKYYYSICEA